MPALGSLYKGNLYVVRFVLGFLVLVTITPSQVATEEPGLRRFTVAEDIGLTQFGDSIMFSRDGQYFVAVSERGRLDLNRPESSLRVYVTEEIHHFLSQLDPTEPRLPFWTISKSTYQEGPIINNVRWLADSSGLVFLAKTASGNDQLFLANLRTKKVQ